MHHFEFITCKKIISELGASSRLGEFCDELGARSPMFVTDAGLIKAGVVDAAINELSDKGMTPFIYSDVQADPPESVVLESVALAKENKVDCVIGLGGGSSLDVAKLIAVLLGTRQDLSEIYGINNVQGERLPLILVPTTAGTGSEVTPISIVTTGETTKTGVVSKQLLPDIAILDAKLTVGLPPQVTAATGIDAMVHAIEAFTSKRLKNPYSDMLAKKALELMSANIIEAVHNGHNLEARSNMLLGAMMAGQAFANAPVAAVHALAYPLGGNYHIPHGLSNSLVLPEVLKFNLPEASSLYSELSHALSSISLPVTYSAEGFVVYMESLISLLELPTRLSLFGIASADLSKLADEAMQQQRLLINNPRVVEFDDAFNIYSAIY